jgi:hypothetical protein
LATGKQALTSERLASRKETFIMKKKGGVDKNGNFVLTVTYNTDSTWEMNKLEEVLADPETKARVVDYDEDYVKVRYPLELGVSKEEEPDTDNSAEDDDTSSADDEEVKDTDTDHHDAMSEDTL